MRNILAFVIFQYISYSSGLEFYNNTSKMRRLCVRTEFEFRIIGGKDCLIEDHPYMVSIHFPIYCPFHRCGGTLINSFFVLTAAHCYVSAFDISEYVIVAGISDMDDIRAFLYNNRTESKKGYEHFGQKHGVRRVLVHPMYDSLDDFNDIALMQLRNPVMQSEKLRFANLPISKYMKHPAEKFKTATAMGWGVQIPMEDVDKPYVSTDVFNRSNNLQCVTLPIINNEECNSYLKSFKYQTLPSQICTLYAPGGKDACFGDSGGPLIHNGTLLGIVSVGYGCAMKSVPAVYTRVDYYVDWIHENSGTNKIKNIVHNDATIATLCNINVIFYCTYNIFKNFNIQLK